MEITVEHVEDLTLDMFKQVLGTLLPEEFTEDMIMSLEIEDNNNNNNNNQQQQQEEEEEEEEEEPPPL